jgi:GNAT superfamily N-acetyltransferase
VIGEARHTFAPDRLVWEFALSVADGWRGRGIGTLLVADMERRARSLGARRLAADAFRSNDAMKALAQSAGFRMADVPFDARLVRMVKDFARSPTSQLMGFDPGRFRNRFIGSGT